MANIKTYLRRVVRLIQPLATPLVLAFILIAMAALAFGHLAEEVREGDTLSFDTSVLLAINRHASHGLDTLFLLITNFGDKLAVAGATAVLIAISIWRRALSTAVFIGLSIGGAAVLNLILKVVFQRQRPELWHQIITETSFSFPSGHAMASAALAVCIITLARHSRWRWLITSCVIIYMILIGLSRLYLGVHYPTDIVGGWLVSVAWVVSVATIWQRYQHRKAVKLTIK